MHWHRNKNSEGGGDGQVDCVQWFIRLAAVVYAAYGISIKNHSFFFLAMNYYEWKFLICCWFCVFFFFSPSRQPHGKYEKQIHYRFAQIKLNGIRSIPSTCGRFKIYKKTIEKFQKVFFSSSSHWIFLTINNPADNDLAIFAYRNMEIEICSNKLCCSVV